MSSKNGAVLTRREPCLSGLCHLDIGAERRGQPGRVSASGCLRMDLWTVFKWWKLEESLFNTSFVFHYVFPLLFFSIFTCSFPFNIKYVFLFSLSPCRSLFHFCNQGLGGLGPDLLLLIFKHILMFSHGFSVFFVTLRG